MPDISQSHGKKALGGLAAPLPEFSSESALTHRTLLAVGKGGCRRLSMRLSKPYWDTSCVLSTSTLYVLVSRTLHNLHITLFLPCKCCQQSAHCILSHPFLKSKSESNV